MDDIDRAQDRESQLRADALTRRHPEIPACGACYNCGEKLAPGVLFCDTDCRDDWERLCAALKRAGYTRG